MIFDVHAHYFPAKYLDALESVGKPDIAESRAQRDAGAERDHLDARIAMMDAAGVQYHVLSPAGQLPYFAREADSVRAARLANDLFTNFVSKRPNRLAAFAVTPLPHIHAALSELARALDELKMAGAVIGSSVLGRSLADPAFEPFYQELNRRGAVLYVHPSGLGAESPLISPHAMTWVIGAPIEDTVAAFHLIVRGIPSRYPNIKIIVSHIGGAMPILLGRLDFLYRDEVPQTPELPSKAARRMWYDTVGHDDPIAIRSAWEAFGPDRLIYGSDYPYQLDEVYTHSVQYIRDSGIPKKDVDIILATGETLFPNLARRPSRAGLQVEWPQRQDRMKLPEDRWPDDATK
jgi:6-methylsalicylate decarboxylase